ncbi:MAG TPA: flagellar biosynthetic protein FliO [Bradyrhizobium sp.]|nr:flagellar biosynthetic protein FliO [Bradyrhizobium sp.]
MISDWGLVVRFLVALAIVLALIAAATWVARRYFGAAMLGGLSGKRRLAVVEYALLDAKSRLVLVRRDTTEHLLVLSQTGAVVVETGIASPTAGNADAGSAANRATDDTGRSGPTSNLRSLFGARS